MGLGFRVLVIVIVVQILSKYVIIRYLDPRVLEFLESFTELTSELF